MRELSMDELDKVVGGGEMRLLILLFLQLVMMLTLFGI